MPESISRYDEAAANFADQVSKEIIWLGSSQKTQLRAIIIELLLLASERPEYTIPSIPADHGVFLDVVKCARCGQDHSQVHLHPFTRRHSNMSHFAPCPVNGEPILFYIIKE